MINTAEYKRNGKMFLALGAAGLAFGAFLTSQGTTLAPLVLFLGVVDVLAAGWMLIKAGRPERPLE